MEERKDYKKIENVDENNQAIHIVSTITYEDEEIYCLCEDGKFYKKISENKFEKLDEKIEKNQKLIKSLLELFKPGFTDVIEDEEYENNDDIIEVKPLV